MEIYTLGDILRHKKSDFFRYRNFGKKSLTELEEVLAEYGLELRQ
jgi:DNA-directed RNA polymerase subunit alpha